MKLAFSITGFLIGVIIVSIPTMLILDNAKPIKSCVRVANHVVHPFYEAKKTYPISITVSNAGVKGQMGRKCYSGYYLDANNPVRCCAVSDNIRKAYPFFSTIEIESNRNPIINGKYMVVDRSTMQNGVEIYVCNPTEVVLGGAWKGNIVVK